jgi:hypothetical protein
MVSNITKKTQKYLCESLYIVLDFTIPVRISNNLGLEVAVE